MFGNLNFKHIIKSNDSNDNSSNRWDKKSHNDKSALSVDNTTKRKFRNYKEEGFGTSNKRKKSLIKLKRIILRNGKYKP